MADPAVSAAHAAPLTQTPAAGLSSAEAAERRSRGMANAGPEHTSRSVAEILRANILTRFNFPGRPAGRDPGGRRAAGCPVRHRACR
jgi:hypothetical protein